VIRVKQATADFSGHAVQPSYVHVPFISIRELSTRAKLNVVNSDTVPTVISLNSPKQKVPN